ncbi:NAD(P)-dependent alcohol dehydrogenase [Paraburkholderia phytofirmans]|uniref:NAD(P)-dependent alcohol dehydrogenase n=1 Tax=Paraburkholderia phytofirmans TaxID=261302 RepID=UPI0038B76BD5
MAAVVEEKGRPFVLQELELEAPRPDEILVRMVAAGICHSDLSVRDQYVPVPLPIVLGHEGAGIVAAVGEAVTNLQVGDRVLLSRLTCGVCPDCRGGHSNYCGSQGVLNLSGGRPDGSTGLSRRGQPVAGHFFGQSSFATNVLAHHNNATKITPDLDLTLAPAFACGVMTGAGAVLNGLKPEAGTSIAVFGCGPVGLAAIMAARTVGCTTIVAIDRTPSRLDIARELGATHGIDAAAGRPAEAVHALVPGGVHYSIDATGVAAVARDAVESLRAGGQCGLLGVSAQGAELTLSQPQVALTGVGIRGFPSGLAEPDVLIPRLIDLYLQGRFPVDRMVTHFPFEAIETAVQEAASGRVLKPILLFD